MTNDRSSWSNEYQAFVEGDSATPPRAVEEALSKRVHADLHPSLGHIFLKLMGLHAVMGSLTLLFCPQFGLSIGSGPNLFDIFMRFGHNVCMAACGITFIGGTALFASWILTTEELRRLRRAPVWPWFVLSGASLAALHLFGAGVLSTYVLVWLTAAGLSGSGILEAGWRLRLFLRERWAV